MAQYFKDDLTGKVFGELTVVRFVPTDSRRSHWLCRCSCGKEIIAYSGHLKSGHTSSCGNFTHRKIKTMPEEAKQKIREAKTKHNGCNERLYRVWASMLNRCENPNEYAYKWYGAKGIKVCEEWHDYAVFREWAMATGYDETAVSHQCSIDRINGDMDYCPDNCRWVDAKAQSNNRKSNVLLTYNGKTQNLKQWSEETGIRYGLLESRWRKGWEVQDILDHSDKRRKRRGVST